jgi:opacity protein-like surface antigen
MKLRLALAALLLATAAHAQVAAPGNQFSEVVPNNTTGVLVAAGAHLVLGVQGTSLSATPTYVKLYDKLTAPTCGTDTPTKRLMIPGASAGTIGAAINYNFTAGVRFVNGIGLCVTTGIGDSDTTAPAATTFTVNIDFN